MSEQEEKNTCESYEIKIHGHLDTGWSEWFYGLTITHEGDDATTLSGPLPDQTVLYSVLGRIRDMNLKLLSVVKLGPDGQTENDDAKGGA